MLDELNALLEESKNVEVTDTFEKTPDGEYTAIIDSCEFCESKNSGNLMFKMELIITGPKYAKKHEWKYYVLNKPEIFDSNGDIFDYLITNKLIKKELFKKVYRLIKYFSHYNII